jgi:hypothetical protein
MAESTITYNCWYKVFPPEEFSIFWLLIERVLNEDQTRFESDSLDWRLRQLIETKHLGEDWYHNIELDDVIGEDSQRFHDLLAKAAHHVLAVSYGKESFWDSLKQPELAREIGHLEYGDPVNTKALLSLIARISLPWFAPPVENPLMRELGWLRLNLRGRSQITEIDGVSPD